MSEMSNVDEPTSKAIQVIVEALKINTTSNNIDHDLLIRLETKVDSLKEEMKNMRDITNVRVTDHENRILALEKADNKNEGKTSVTMPLIIALSTIGGGIIMFLLQLLLKHP